MNIFVGCSSKDTNNEHYNRIAEEIGDFIVKRKHNLVFGGCDRGLMGKIYAKVSQSGTDSEVIVVIAKAFEDDLKTLSYSEVRMFETVNEREDCFNTLADAMIFIPGGIGTLDEILTAIETKRNHEHEAPIIIINVDNFYGHLLEMLNRIYDEGFADSKNREIYFIANSLKEAVDYLSKLEIKT